MSLLCSGSRLCSWGLDESGGWGGVMLSGGIWWSSARSGDELDENNRSVGGFQKCESHGGLSCWLFGQPSADCGQKVCWTMVVKAAVLVSFERCFLMDFLWRRAERLFGQPSSLDGKFTRRNNYIGAPPAFLSGPGTELLYIYGHCW
jgi:hypothetical protein